MYIKEITENLEANDETEQMEDLLLLNDLEEPIDFKDREEIINSITILLHELIVTPNGT